MSRLGTVDALRCIAGTLVLWFHLTHNSRNSLIRESGSFGWVGVEVFFVVSGFIIPYAMHRSAYEFPGLFGRFIARRLIRLDPPYFVASFMAAVLWIAASHAPGYGGAPAPISWAASLAHIGYLNGILGLPWYNGVCWTLGIEFQFYLFAALAYRWLVGCSHWFSTVTAALLVGTVALFRHGVLPGVFTGSPWLLSWAPCFLIGISAFRAKIGLTPQRQAVVLQLLCAAAGACMGRSLGAAAALAAGLLIQFTNIQLHPLVAAYAALTYSLYLVQVPLGERAIRLAQRLGTDWLSEFLALSAGLAVSLLAAVAFYRWIELPSLRLASRIPLRQDGAAAGAVVHSVKSDVPCN